MQIELLPQEVRSYLRTGVAITSVTQCVEELVLNSLDAGATCVAVRVDLNCFKLQVVDNGSGVSKDQLELVGNRFCTSKCHGISDLQSLCHFGYRGEALASMRDSCGVLEITTRTKTSSKTYCKLFQQGKSLKVSESTIPRPSAGTTVTIHELFMNFPVRQKSLNKPYELEKIRETLESIALIRPGISLSLRNDTTGQVIFQTRKCSDCASVFSQLYGPGKAEMLQSVHGTKDVYNVSGHIGCNGHSRKNLQFVYINGRLVKKSKVHKLLNQTLSNLPSLKPKLRPFSDSPDMSKQGQYIFKSPPKFSEAYPVYIIQIACPISEYDITFEPAKTMVEFKDWDPLLNCVENVSKQFVTEQNGALTEIKAAKKLQEQNDKASDDNKSEESTKMIVAENLTDAVQSKAVKNQSKTNEHNRTDNESGMFKTPRNEHRPICRAAVGLGNRKLCRDTDVGDTGDTDVGDTVETSVEESSDTSTSTLETSTTSVSDDSNLSQAIYSEQGKSQGYQSSKSNSSKRPKLTREVLSTVTATKASTEDNHQESNMQGSLSRYKQSIGKFASKHKQAASVDESLKKLSKILPQTVKPTSGNMFSSLQRFRRKAESSRRAFDDDVDTENNTETDAISFAPAEERFDLTLSKQKKSLDDLGQDAGSREPISAPQDNFKDVNRENRSDMESLQQSSYQSYTEITPREIVTDINTNFSLCGPFVTKEENCNEVRGEDLPCRDIDSPEYRAYRLDDNGGNTEFRDNQWNELNRNCKTLDSDQYESYKNKSSEATRTTMGQLSSTRTEFDAHKMLTEHDLIHTNTNIEHGKNVESSRKRTLCIDEAPYQNAEVTGKSMKLSGDLDITNEEANCDKRTDTRKCNTSLPACDKSMGSGIVPVPSNCCDNMDTGMFSSYVKPVNNTTNYDIESSAIADLKSDLTDKVTMGEDDLGEVKDVTSNRPTHFTDNPKNDLPDYCTQPFIPQLNNSLQTPVLNCNLTTEINEKFDGRRQAERTPESMGFTPKLDMVVTPDNMSTGFSPVINTETVTNDELSETGIELEHEVDTNCGSNVTKYTSTLENDTLVDHGVLKTDIPGDTSDQVVMSSGVVMEENMTAKPEETVDLEQSLTGQSTYDSVTLTQMLKSISQTSDNTLTRREAAQSTRDISDQSQLSDTMPGRKYFTFHDLFDPSQTPVGEKCTCSQVLEEENVNEKGDFTGNLSMFSEAEWENDVIKVEPKAVETEGCEMHLSQLVDENPIVGNNSLSAASRVSDDFAVAGPSGIGDGQDDKPWYDSQLNSQIDHSGLDTNKWRATEIGTAVSIVKKHIPPDQEFVPVPDFITKQPAGTSASIITDQNACQFSKQSLSNVQVIGQLDKKFITCLLNSEKTQSDGDSSMLVLVDQHAAHERIRLEVLTEDAFIDGKKGGSLLPFAVEPPRLLEFTENEVRNIEGFKSEYSRIGMSFKQQSSTSLLVNAVPDCLVERKNGSMKIYWNTIQVLMREHLAVFMSTRGAQSIVPQTVHKVLCSQACHGAIKFGDRLSNEECSSLVGDLSHCDLPFQCAHGRPSVMPLLHLDRLQHLSTQEKKKPQLWKLRKIIQEQQKQQ